MKTITYLIISIILLPLSLTLAANDPILVIDPGGHKAMIKDVMFTNDGRYLISASNDKTIRVWDVRTGTISRIIRGQIGKGDEGKIYAAALSPDNEWLAYGGFMKNDEIRLYHFPSGRLVALLKGHSNVVFSLSFSPNSRFLASGSSDDTVRVWNIEDQIQIHKLTGHKDAIYALSWLPDSRRLVSGSDDNTLILWDARKGTKIQKLIGHEDDVQSVAVSPNSKYIASGSLDKTIRLWDARDGEFIKVLAKQNTQVASLSFSPDSRMVLTGTGDGSGKDICHLYSVPSGNELQSFTKHDNIVLATAISPDGRLAATGGGNNNEIYLWDTQTGAVRHKLVGNGKVVWSVGFGSDGESIAWGNEWEQSNRGPLQYWMKIPASDTSFRVEFMGKLKNTHNFNRAVENKHGYSLRTKKGGNYGYNAILEVIKNERIIAKIERGSTSGLCHSSYSLTPDSRYIASGGANGVLSLFETKTGDKVRDFIGHTGDVWAVALSPDGKKLISGSFDQTVRLWNTQTGENLLTIFIGSDMEWVAWTPSGFYTSSPDGDKYIGWHVNKGEDKIPAYHSAFEFSDILYRPDIVAQTLVKSSEKEALASLGIRQTVAEIIENAPPEVRILKPENGFKTASSMVNLEVKIDDTRAAIRDIAIYVNGSQVLASNERRVSDPFGGGIKRFSVPINDLRNQIMVQVTNIHNARASSIVEVLRKTIIAQKGNLYFLGVGVNKLKNIPLNDLDFPAKDAQNMADLMIKLRGKLFKNVYTYVFSDFSDNEPISWDIEDALDELSNANKKDTVMIFLAGHGVTTQNNQFIFLTRNAKRYGNGSYKTSSVLQWQSIYNALKMIDARRIVLLDTCYAGSVDMQDILKKGSDNHIAIISSSSGSETSLESKKLGNGLFTYAILKGLGRGLPADTVKDGKVELTELISYVRAEVKKINPNQTPNIALPIGMDNTPFFAR
ncbi:Peptidase C14 caspase domain-containing protein [Candidatus Magnetomoraceae bacterium gMMP-15]